MSERTRESVLCLIFGHDWYVMDWELTGPHTHRVVHGDVCKRCQRFEPRGAGSVSYPPEDDPEGDA